MVDWCQLPYDLVTAIANQLHSFKDFLVFSAVCRSWRSVYLNKNWSPGPQLPWLMLSEDRNIETRGFYSLDEKALHNLGLNEIRGKRCWGSSSGWLVTTGIDREIEMLNPITRVRLGLPSQFMFPKQSHIAMILDWSRLIYKAIVIKMPFVSREFEDEYVVMAIYGLEKHLAFAKPGYDSWVPVRSSLNRSFRDVTHFEGRIFALCEMGTLVHCEIDGPEPPRARYIAPAPEYDWGVWDQIYLVESSGHLLMVIRHDYDISTEYYYETTGFKVFKFDLGTRKWKELKDLGDCALFLGQCSSMSLSASSVSDCEPNSIYFTVDKLKRWWKYRVNQVGRDMGVYNIADKSFKHLYSGADSPSYYSCPTWLVPSLS